MSNLPSEAAARKGIPVATGFIDYFPDAVAEVARLSKVANEQHNPGTPLHWDRSKSGDESDALMRHFLERGTIDDDGQRHSAKVAWRAMALLQKELEAEAIEAELVAREDEFDVRASYQMDEAEERAREEAAEALDEDDAERILAEAEAFKGATS